MGWKQGRARRSTCVSCVAGALTLGLVAPGGASGLFDGDPCSPFWTEVGPSAPIFTFAASSFVSSVPIAFDASLSTPGKANKWTFVLADGMCEPTSIENDPIATFAWNFGDGNSAGPSSSATTSHTYAAPGRYSVTLTVTERNCQAGTDAHCFTNQQMQEMVITNLPPVASFTAPASAVTGRAVSFDASNSTDPDSRIVGYHWDFGDGQTEDTSGPTASHSYRLSGGKLVTLTVTDDGGGTDRATHKVSVVHLPPVASFTAPASVITGQPARFDGSASSDPDGTIEAYLWDFGDGQTQTTTTPIATHIYAKRGTRAVTLTVVDDSAGTSLTCHTVTVVARPPIASFRSPTTVSAGQAVRFDASGSSAPGGTITSYRWDFGDGTAQTTAGPGVSHAYRKTGTNAVTLTVTDDNDNTAQTQHAITVVARRCVVPRLVGTKLGQARTLLSRGNCRLGAVRRKHARPRNRGRVTGQSVKPGATRSPGAAVTVTVGN